jgi:hypothetical protein
MPIEELAALQRVAALIAELDPATAWELDAQLEGMAKVAAILASGLETWGERLSAIALHDSVTGAAVRGSGRLADIAEDFARARANLRTVYAAQFAAAEAAAREVARKNFWGDSTEGTVAPGIMTLTGDDNSPYVDWSSATGDSLVFEIGDGTKGAGVMLTQERVAELVEQIGLTLAGDPRAQGHIGDTGEWSIDWSVVTASGGRRVVLGNDDGDVAVLELTTEQLRALHGQLAADLHDAEPAAPVGSHDDAALRRAAEAAGQAISRKQLAALHGLYQDLVQHSNGAPTVYGVNVRRQLDALADKGIIARTGVDAYIIPVGSPGEQIIGATPGFSVGANLRT